MIGAARREGDLLARLLGGGPEAPLPPLAHLSTDQVLLLLEQYRRLQSADPLGGVGSMQARFGGGAPETGLRWVPERRSQAETEQLAAARNLLFGSQLGLTSPLGFNSPLNPNAPLGVPRRAGIARQIRVNPNQMVAPLELLNRPSYGGPLAAGRSNQAYPTTRVLTSGFDMSNARHSQLPSSDLQLNRSGWLDPPVNPSPARQFLGGLPQQDDLSGLLGGAYRAARAETQGPLSTGLEVPIASMPVSSFTQLGRGEQSPAKLDNETPASSALLGPPLDLLRAEDSLARSRSSASGVATSVELPPTPPSGTDARDASGMRDTWDLAFLGP